MFKGKRDKRNKPEYHCSFCGKTQADVRRLIAGPSSAYICDECVERAWEPPGNDEKAASSPEEMEKFTGDLLARVAESVEGQQLYVYLEDARKKGEIPAYTLGYTLPVPGKKRFKNHCSFCGKGQKEVRKLIAGLEGVNICNECLELCAEIIEEENPNE